MSSYFRNTLRDQSVGRHFAAAIFAVFLCAIAAAPAAAAVDPMGVVKQTVTDAVSVLRDRQAPTAQRAQKLKDIVAGTFDFTEMAKSGLGYHWKQLTPDQQKEFTAVFITFIENSYLAKMNEYSGQQVQFLTQQNDGPEYATIKTNLVQPGKEPISIDYRLLNGRSMEDLRRNGRRNQHNRQLPQSI